MKAKKVLIGSALVFDLAASVLAEPAPFMQAGTAQPPLPPAAPTAGTNETVAAATNAINEFFNGKLPAVLANGNFNLNVRLRYEQFNEEGLSAITKDSYAPTIRTRFGFTTAPLHGFQAMLEGVNVSVLGPEHNYNAAGANGQNDRPSVPDPPLTRIDQAWLDYTYTNWIATRAGEQEINLDNQRFIGNSGWWQNIQTFEAATLRSEPLEDLNLFYSYLWRVHRIYGNISGLPAANTDFDSDSHLFNASYSGWKYGRFVGYTYLLDLKNAAGAANSCATYGGYFAGGASVCDQLAVDYRAEFAWQNNYGDSPLRYGAEYYNLEAGASLKRFAVGAGYEDLGSGVNSGAAGGRASFRTPLATLHPFNGWANIFGTTPADGLRDLYGYAQVTLPAQIPVRFVYHKFDAAYGSGNFGQEFDFYIIKKLGRYWNVSIQYAYYQGQDAAPPSLTAAHVDVQKLWAQVEFNF